MPNGDVYTTKIKDKKKELFNRIFGKKKWIRLKTFS